MKLYRVIAFGSGRDYRIPREHADVDGRRCKSDERP
jgi:hypothetical protein